MAKTIKEERLRWVLPIAKEEVKLVDVTKGMSVWKTELRTVVSSLQEGRREGPRTQIYQAEDSAKRDAH